MLADMRRGAPPARGLPGACRRVRRAWFVGALLAIACASSPPPAYQRSRAAAERAYVHGRYAEAAEHWLEAARHAERGRDRNEARYRAAASLARAGDHVAAGRLYEEISQTPQAERAARAAFDQAKLEIAEGNPERGYRLLRQALLAHPDSGLAPGALRRLLAWRASQAGLADVLRTLDSLLEALGETELG
jgi:tetratricopeptide (TPR) repeat protein